MKKLFEVYTEKGTFEEEQVELFIADANTVQDVNYEQIARYVYQDDNGRNILVECDVPTGANPQKSIYLTVYTYEGEFEDYEAVNEIRCEEFNGDWCSLEAFMRDMAETKSYLICVSTSSEYYIPNAEHIEKDDEANLVENDSEASVEAEKDGVKLIYNMSGVPNQVYIDTPENRKVIMEALEKYPEYKKWGYDAEK